MEGAGISGRIWRENLGIFFFFPLDFGENFAIFGQFLRGISFKSRVNFGFFP